MAETTLSPQSIARILEFYGFIVVRNGDEAKILDLLRRNGVIHLFQVHRYKEYTIIEINRVACERECEITCRHVNGLKDSECFTQCIDDCIKNRTRTVISKLAQ